MSSTENEWQGFQINTSNRHSTPLEYSSHSNKNSSELSTSSGLRISRFPQIDTGSRQQQLSPAFQRLSPRSKELFKSYDFSLSSITVGLTNNRDNDSEFPFEEVHKKNYSTLDLAAERDNRMHDNKESNLSEPLPRNPPKPRSIDINCNHEGISTTLAYRGDKSPKNGTANEWSSTSIVLGEEDLPSSDDEDVETRNSVIKSDFSSANEIKRRFGSEKSSDILFGQSAHTLATQTKGKSDSTSLSSTATSPLSAIDTNRERISLQRVDAAISSTRKTQELEALKKRSKVSSMCKSFENKIGGNSSELPPLPSRNHLMPFESRIQLTAESVLTPRLTAVAENDKTVFIEDNENITSIRDVKQSTQTETQEDHHQAVINNIITASLSPMKKATNVKANSDNETMKWKSTVFPANITAAMCVTKDDSNNNDKVSDNNKQQTKLPADKNGKTPNGTTATTNANGTAAVNGTMANSNTANGVPLKPPVKRELVSDDGIPLLKLRGFVGFDSLPYQLVKKCQNEGFQFNLLCVGETGMGKTTLIESLFNRKMDFEPCNSELKTVELRTKYCEVEESNVRVKLRVVETAGFGDQLDKEKSAKVIVDYINEQFEAYLREELKITRFLSGYDDTRIHACLYFISPTGHGLKALDVVTMRELSKRANVIPVIAKSDTACKDELIRFKQKIMNELKANNIEVYQFPVDDEAVRKENAALNALLPFAVVGSCDFVTKEDGRQVRARNYVWGRVEVENEEHCDFVKLREALLRINEDSLRERTHTVLYEAYRRQRLQEMRMADGDAGPRMAEATLKRKKEFEAEVRRRDEQFKLEFESRVQRKEADLKHREDGLHHRQRDIDDKFHRESQDLDNEIARVRAEIARLLTAGGKKQRK